MVCARVGDEKARKISGISIKNREKRSNFVMFPFGAPGRIQAVK